MRISVITIFPGYFESPLRFGVTARAVAAGVVEVVPVDLRLWGKGRHRQVDDAPFGGGPGMVMMVEPIAGALDEVDPRPGDRPPGHRVLLSPAGEPLRQAHLDRWARLEHLILVCGRYEGVDERVAEHLVDEEVSLGDFVLAGGEPAALCIIEGVARLVPGGLGNPGSTAVESFRDGLLEEPQYTRPAEFRGWKVPEVLLSGDHARIAEWRLRQRLERTRRRRPDLLGGDGSAPRTDC